MPKNWLASKPAPDPPVLDWLKWTAHDLERHTISGMVAAIIGVTAFVGWMSWASQSGALRRLREAMDANKVPSMIKEAPAASLLN